METVNIKLFATPVLTLTGKKTAYALGDMAYGEWIVFKDDYPCYYLNVLEGNQKSIENNSDLESFITDRLPSVGADLSLKQSFTGVKLSSPQVEWLDLQKLTYDMLTVPSK